MSQRSAAIAAAMATAEVSDSAAAEGGDAAGLLVQPLKAGEHRYLFSLLEALDELRAVDVENSGGGMGVGGEDRKLPALPGAGIDAHPLEHDGEQSGGDLLAGRHDGVVFAGVVQRSSVAAPGYELVGRPRHGGDHHRHLVAGVDFALDVAGDIADALDIGDRGSAELHHQSRHGQRFPGKAAIHKGAISGPQPRQPAGQVS